MKQKKIYRIIGLVFSGVLLTMCSKDDGNYDYRDPGTVDFFGMVDEMTALFGEQLYIEPVYATLANESDLSYLWYRTITDDADEAVTDTISTERVLDVINRLPVGENDIYFNVYNRTLDVNYRHTIEVQVATAFSQGWGLLKDKGGIAGYDFISYITNTHFENLLENTTDISLSGSPLLLDYWRVNSLNNPAQNLTILTEEDYVVFDNEDLTVLTHGLDENIRDMSNLTLPVQGGSLGTPAWRRANLGVLFIGGELHMKLNELGSYADLTPEFSGIPMAGDYSIGSSPHGCFLSGWYFVFFDDLNKRYLYVEGDRDVELVVAPFLEPVDISAFDPNNLNGDVTCLWMDGTVGESDGFSNRGVSILKDESARYYLQSMEVTFGPVFAPEYEVEVPAGYINDNSLWLHNPAGTYTYFTNGGTVGRFTDGDNPTSGNFDPDYITNYAANNIMSWAISDDGFTLALVLEDGANSILVLYDLVNATETERYTVEGHVVDIDYWSFD